MYIRHDGIVVDAAEALDHNGALKSGYRFKMGLMRDHDAGSDSNGQAAYEQRIADAWRGDHNPVIAADAVNGQAAYEQRISNAWKGGNNV